MPDPNPADLQQAPDGRISGIDGLLDQVAAALVRRGSEALRDTVIPAIRRDAGLQREIGYAAGRAIAKELRPWAVLVAAGVVTMAGVAVVEAVARRRERREAAA